MMRRGHWMLGGVVEILGRGHPTSFTRLASDWQEHELRLVPTPAPRVNVHLRSAVLTWLAEPY